MFKKENKVDPEKTQVVFEITLSNLRASGGEIDEQDFMDRARLLCSLGQTVLISNFQEYYKLVEYFSLYSRKRMVCQWESIISLIFLITNTINI